MHRVCAESVPEVVAQPRSLGMGIVAGLGATDNWHMHARLVARSPLALMLAALLTGLCVLMTSPARATDPPGSVTMGPQAMEGDLTVAPGTDLTAGYDF